MKPNIKLCRKREKKKKQYTHARNARARALIASLKTNCVFITSNLPVSAAFKSQAFRSARAKKRKKMRRSVRAGGYRGESARYLKYTHFSARFSRASFLSRNFYRTSAAPLTKKVTRKLIARPFRFDETCRIRRRDLISRDYAITGARTRAFSPPREGIPRGAWRDVSRGISSTETPFRRPKKRLPGRLVCATCGEPVCPRPPVACAPNTCEHERDAARGGGGVHMYATRTLNPRLRLGISRGIASLGGGGRMDRERGS